MPPQKIRTCLWYDSQAEAACEFYVSLFAASRITRITPGPHGRALVVEFELSGIEYLAINGGPVYQLSEAASLYVHCADQDEIDRLWEALVAGGRASRCGWLTDRFGLSWQIMPATLPSLLADPRRGGQVMQTLLGMEKIDLAKLESAANGT